MFVPVVQLKMNPDPCTPWSEVKVTRTVSEVVQRSPGTDVPEKTASSGLVGRGPL